MLLSNTAIKDLIKQGAIKIKPFFKEEHLRPVGIRIHLGKQLLIPEPGQIVDLSKPTELKYIKHDLERKPYIIEPGSFVLASTIEQVQTTPKIMCILEGRSTIARLGLAIHNTAGILDGSSFEPLTPVLELANHGNFQIVLKVGIPIGMLCFQSLSKKVSPESLHSQYARQNGTIPPNLLEGARIIATNNTHCHT